jgi:hypothetical protein
MILWHMSSKVLDGFYASEVWAAAETEVDAIEVALGAYDRWIAEGLKDYGYNRINDTWGRFEDDNEYESETKKSRKRFHDELKEKLKPVSGRASIHHYS